MATRKQLSHDGWQEGEQADQRKQCETRGNTARQEEQRMETDCRATRNYYVFVSPTCTESGLSSKDAAVIGHVFVGVCSTDLVDFCCLKRGKYTWKVHVDASLRNVGLI